MAPYPTSAIVMSCWSCCSIARRPGYRTRRLLVLFMFLYDGSDRNPWVVPVLVKGSGAVGVVAH
jgi:hypothetical protein